MRHGLDTAPALAAVCAPLRHSKRGAAHPSHCAACAVRVAVGVVVESSTSSPAVGASGVSDPLAVSDLVSQPPPTLRELPNLIWSVLFEQMPAPHWFGSDSSGMDVFSRTLYAARVDLIIAFSAFSSEITAYSITSLPSEAVVFGALFTFLK